jgi:hypothetical protein
MNRYYTFICLLLSLLTLASCVGDEIFFPDQSAGGKYDDNPGSHATNAKQLTLNIHIPGTNAPVTFAYSELDENDVRTIDILVFKITSEGEYYYRHIPVNKIRNNNSTTNKSLDVTIDAIDARLILLANVRRLFTDEMNRQLRQDSITGNVEEQSILSRFEFNFIRPWTSQRFNDGEAFPMYGRSSIIPAASTTAGEIKMIRSIARIDIANSTPNAAWSIDSIYIVNSKNKGYVAPSFGSGGAIAEIPNIPVSAAPNAVSFSYPFTANAGVTTQSMEREIYITEDCQTSTTHPTGIVLKVIKPGSKPQYYRADLKDSNGNLLPILRNYRYRIFITGISGNGYETVEEAAVRPHSSVSSEVETDELGMGNIVFNDDHKFGVSAQHIHFNADGSHEQTADNHTTYVLKIFTTYINWSISADALLADWLAIDGSNNLEAEHPSDARAINLAVAANPSATPRCGRLYLKSGALRQEITITQDGQPISTP